MDSADSKGSGQSAAVPVLLPVVDPGDLHVHLLMYPHALHYARLAHHHSSCNYSLKTRLTSTQTSV